MTIFERTILQHQTVGFSGTRSPKSEHRNAVQAILGACGGASILVGDAMGIDFEVAQFMGKDRVTVVPKNPREPVHKRSIRFVKELACLPRPLLVAVPDTECPLAIEPTSSSRKAFCGCGSGTWATTAFAVGLGIPALVYVESERPAPWWIRTRTAGYQLYRNWYILKPR